MAGRPLGEYPFLFLDACYEQLREGGPVHVLAILVAVCVNPAGERELLGVSVEAYLAKAVEKYRKNASGLSQWLAANIPEGLTVFAFSASFRRLLRTTNGVERLHREVRRRARVISIFPNSASRLRLVSAILAEMSEEWLTGRTCMIFEDAT